MRFVKHILVPLIFFLAAGDAMGFKPPSSAERIAAIGSLADVPENLRLALEPGHDFEPVPKPGPSDWLANQGEAGQTFEKFIRARPNKPTAVTNTIYLQPLGKFEKGVGPSLDQLQQFASLFFSLKVKVLPPMDLHDISVTRRRNPYTHNIQLLTTDILALLRLRLPEDAVASLGITMDDLYPDPRWNFVFGQASLVNRVGVYSFARYDPLFYNETPRKDRQRLMLKRSCKVLAHEMAHMFGMRHCICFHCLMNGSNHLAESDGRPLHLCPVDLRKLQYLVGFDFVARYRGLMNFYNKVGLSGEAQWLRNRLEHIAGM